MSNLRLLLATAQRCAVAQEMAERWPCPSTETFVLDALEELGAAARDLFTAPVLELVEIPALSSARSLPAAAGPVASNEAAA